MRNYVRVDQWVSVDSWRRQYASAYVETAIHATEIGRSYGCETRSEGFV